MNRSSYYEKLLNWSLHLAVNPERWGFLGSIRHINNLSCLIFPLPNRGCLSLSRSVEWVHARGLCLVAWEILVGYILAFTSLWLRNPWRVQCVMIPSVVIGTKDLGNREIHCFVVGYYTFWQHLSAFHVFLSFSFTFWMLFVCSMCKAFTHLLFECYSDCSMCKAAFFPSSFLGTNYTLDLIQFLWHDDSVEK